MDDDNHERLPGRPPLQDRRKAAGFDSWANALRETSPVDAAPIPFERHFAADDSQRRRSNGILTDV
jgi:hypothetical protein